MIGDDPNIDYIEKRFYLLNFTKIWKIKSTIKSKICKISGINYKNVVHIYISEDLNHELFISKSLVV